MVNNENKSLKKRIITTLVIILVLGISAGTVLITSAREKTGFNGQNEFSSFERGIRYEGTDAESQAPIKLIKVPTGRQSTSYYCGPECIRCLLRWENYCLDIRQDNLAKALNSNEKEGTKMVTMCDYLNAVTLDDERCFEATIPDNPMTIQDLKDNIDQGKPVIIALQAWGTDDNDDYSWDTDYSNKWEDGHCAVAIGYDNENIIFMDPSTAANYTYIPFDKLDERWHDYDGKKLKNGIIYEHKGIIVEAKMTPEYPEKINSFYGLL